MELITNGEYFEVWCGVCKVMISTWWNKYGLNPLYEIQACPGCKSDYIDTIDPVALRILGREDILKKIEDQKIGGETVTAEDIEEKK